MTAVHVLPRDDLIEHVDVGDECPCGPTSTPVKREDGSVGWVITHHSLDGRELGEPVEGRCGTCDAVTDQLPCPFCGGDR